VVPGGNTAAGERIKVSAHRARVPLTMYPKHFPLGRKVFDKRPELHRCRLAAALGARRGPARRAPSSASSSWAAK